MMDFNSFYTVADGYNLGTKWPNGRRVFLPTIKTFEGICLAIVGKFLQKELWSLFVFETLLFIQTIKSLFMNMSAK